MKKNLLILTLGLLVLLSFINTKAQNLSSDPTITFSNNSGFADNIAQDGEGGSTAITDINIQVMPINSSGAKLSADPLEFHSVDWSVPPIITYGGINSHYGWAIKSDNGSDFTLKSVGFHDWGEWSGETFVAQAFNNGSSKGTVTFNGNTNNTVVTLTYPGTLTNIFQDVDEVRIYKQGGANSWTGLNAIQVSSPTIVLPVTWLNFSAISKNDAVAVNWSTAREENNNIFLVQRSENGTNWNTVATIPSASNSNTTQTYSFIDKNLSAGTYFYRILQRDINGKESHTKTVAVSLKQLQQSLIIYPNPTTDGSVTIKMERTSIVDIYNNAGVLLMRKKLNSGVQPINISHLPKGIYIIKATGKTFSFIVQ